MTRKTRHTAAVAMAALLFTAAGSAGDALGAKRDSASKRPPSQAVVAKKLAARVTRARTPAARSKAILAVMRTLRVGIITPKGKPVVRAGRPYEIYLYDFEIKAMAAALGRKHTTTVEDLAGRLTAGGMTPGGKPLAATQLARTLSAGARAARARPRARRSLVPLLARELGRRQRHAYDLARAPARKLRLDSLQTFLINAEITAAASNRGGAAGRVATAAAGGPCDLQALDVVKELMPFGKWVISLVKAVKDQAKIATLGIEAIHGSILAFSVGFTSLTPTNQQTHYGSTGHDPDAGKTFDFRVRLVMRDQLPEAVISCGPLLGMKFPDKGPIPGVIVAWAEDSAIAAPLDNHGTTTYPTGRKTNAKGETSLHFTPKNEKLPGFGSVHYAGNTKRAIALYQTAFGNMAGSVAQFLTPKEVRFGWNLSFHLPRGFKFAGMVRDNYFQQSGKPVGFGDPGGDAHPAGRVDVDMHVCGDDPFAPWTGTKTYVSEGTPLKAKATWAFVPGVSTSPVRSDYGTTESGLKGQLNLAPPFSATFMGLNAITGKFDGPFSLPLEEPSPLECPDNTPFGASP
jgi:hypothetical protein